MSSTQPMTPEPMTPEPITPGQPMTAIRRWQVGLISVGVAVVGIGGLVLLADVKLLLSDPQG